MKKVVKKVSGLLILIALLAVVVFLSAEGETKSLIKGSSEKTYTSANYGFAFKYPPDFTIREIPEVNKGLIIVEDSEKKPSMQILISPFGADKGDITEAGIRADIPDIAIEDPKEISISGGKGLAFVSDNENFGGKSREIWFVHEGFLYQLSAYYESGGMLDELFKEWEFGDN